MKRDIPGGIAGAQQGLHPAVHAIVLDALAKGVGGTLAKNADLRDQLGVGIGTVHRALELLAERGALVTTGRGHLGRRIDTIEIGECWQAAGLAPIRIVLSPLGPIEMDVLESTLGDELTARGVPHTVRHRRGGNARMESVAAGLHDVTVASAGTFDGMTSDRGEQWHSKRLPAGTYYVPERLVTLRRRATAGARARVAIDRASFDHEALTRAEFGSDAEFIEIPFTDVPAAVLAGVVDAGIWHVTSSPIPPALAGLELDELREPRSWTVRDALSGAVIAGWLERTELRSVIDALEFRDLASEQKAQIALDDARLAGLMAGGDALASR